MKGNENIITWYRDKGIYSDMYVSIKELLNNRVQTTHQTFNKELSI